MARGGILPAGNGDKDKNGQGERITKRKKRRGATWRVVEKSVVMQITKAM